MKRRMTTALLSVFVACAACTGGLKEEQTIVFEEIPAQLLKDGAVRLNATASSGLPVIFVSSNYGIASVEGDGRAVFHQAGEAYITARQPGNEAFYEAPEVRHLLLVRDYDPGKKDQTIRFELPSEWKESRDGIVVQLQATSVNTAGDPTGLPVRFTLGGPRAGYITAGGVTLVLYHYGETPAFPREFAVTVTITASQEGNGEYNPANRVERKMYVVGDVPHS